MREIIFRGKRKDNGEWVEGFYCGGNERNTLHPAIFIYLPDKQSYDYQDIDINTLGQYTGVTDKNGTKIFEGDIVKVENALVRGIFAVECGMGANFIVSHGERRFFFGGRSSEVIGNIHDNPELLQN